MNTYDDLGDLIRDAMLDEAPAQVTTPWPPPHRTRRTCCQAAAWAVRTATAALVAELVWLAVRLATRNP